jgi:thiol:disulfide interchange protein
VELYSGYPAYDYVYLDHINRMKTRLIKPLLLLFVAFMASLSSAQQVIKWSTHLVSGEAKPGANVTVELDAAIDAGWHLYAITKTKAGNIPTEITATAPAKLTGPVAESKPVLKYDKNFEAQVEFFENTAKFTIPVQLGPDGKGSLAVMFQACNDRSCLPPATVSVPIGGSAAPAPAAGASTPPAQTPVPQDQGLIPFIAFAFGAGLLALLTPCVFPMVPITVSYFAKQHEKAGGKATIAQPLAYCLGIISAFTGFGILVTILFGASGIQKFATNPIVNLGLAVLFIVLALNLFGIYEISLPVGLTNRFSHRGKSGLIAPVLMGLTFTLTSFTCTVPFVGTILISAAKGQLLYPLVGMLAFSSAFALPFFLLAMFPQYLAKLPKSGSWLAAVKGFMGFLEIAAAVKFFSNADLVWGTGILSRTRFLEVWVVIFGLAALFLAGVFKLKSVEMPKRFGPARMVILGLTVLTIGYLVYGTSGSSLGEMEAYLPPSKSGWLESYDKALEIAKRTNKPVFINFTGVTCTNCRWMEKNMFPNPDVKKALDNYVKLELYTDKQSKEDADNQALQQRLTGTVALPVYLCVSPEGKILAKFESSTRSTQEFLTFLRSVRS